MFKVKQRAQCIDTFANFHPNFAINAKIPNQNPNKHFSPSNKPKQVSTQFNCQEYLKQWNVKRNNQWNGDETETTGIQKKTTTTTAEAANYSNKAHCVVCVRVERFVFYALHFHSLDDRSSFSTCSVPFRSPQNSFRFQKRYTFGVLATNFIQFLCEKFGELWLWFPKIES